MSIDTSSLLIVVGIGVAAVASFAAGYWISAVKSRARMREAVASARADTSRRQRSTVGGQVAEVLRPYIGDFPYDPSELTFIGDPIDFVVFRGKAKGLIEEIVFVEVKRGAGSLSPAQRQVRAVVEAGRIRWYEARFPEPTQ